MKRTLLPAFALTALLLAPAPSQAQAIDVQKVLKGVEDRYNKTDTLRADFTQIYRQRGRTKTDKGVLYLQKPGKTRWEYAAPSKRLFISDNKYAYDYDPENQRFERRPMKETEDLGIALGFLLGKLDFYKHFDTFRAKPEGENVFIMATPKSDRLLFTQISMLIGPDYRLHKVIVDGQDFSSNEYVLANEQRNVRVDPAMFKPPSGVKFVELDQ